MNQIFSSALLEWPLLVCSLAIFGSSAFALMASALFRPAGYPAANRVDRLWRILALVLTIDAPFALIDEVARMAAVPFTSAPPFVIESLELTHVGRLWLWRLAIIALILIFAWAKLRARYFRIALLGALAAAMLILRCLSSHAIDRGAAAVAACVLHECAAATWFGALSFLVCAASQAKTRDTFLAKAAPSASTVAGWSVLVLVLSGLYMAWLALGLSAGNLIYTAYGRTLVVKVALFLVVLGAGGYNRYRLIPAIAAPDARRMLMRNVTVECVFLICVIGFAALLANTPPPHGHAGHHMAGMDMSNPAAVLRGRSELNCVDAPIFTVPLAAESVAR
ncbi:MAG: copper resistance D family protein [Candidatus Binataceae bacterium]